MRGWVAASRCCANVHGFVISTWSAHMRLTFVLIAAALLASCSRPPRNYADDLSGADAPAVEAALAPPAGAGLAKAPASAPARTSPAAVAGPMLAYSYRYGVSAPARAVRGLLARHEAACAGAGPTHCQVIASSVSEAGEDRVSASLSFRAAPDWLGKFRAGLAGQAKAVGGKVVNATVTSDDLSRQIVDTEATLRAKAALRDRLQAMLGSRPGKLSDLLDVERELARVQGEIDAAQSELEMMRARVAMSEVTLSYESEGVLAPQGVFAPLARATSEFVGIIALGLAAMVRLVAWIMPWLVVIGTPAWIFRKRLFKGRLSRNAASEAS